MIHGNSFRRVQESVFEKNFLKPLYGSYCFSEIPTMIASNFGVQERNLEFDASVLPNYKNNFEKIIVFVVDGLGWRFFEEGLSDHSFYRWIHDEGVVSQFTSMFPSTTVVHVLAMASGLLPWQTGILEWYYYEPNFGRVICPLPYTLAGEESGPSLSVLNSHPNAVFPNRSFPNILQTVGVSSYIYQSKKYTPSALTVATAGNAKLVPFKNVEQGLDALFENMKAPGKAYHYFYIDTVDSVSHKHGPLSRQAKTAASDVLAMLRHRLHGKQCSNWKNTLLLVTADHGQVTTDLNSVVYLNRLWPEISALLESSHKTHTPLVPCGGNGRNLFLHVKSHFVGEVVGKLKKLLDGKAQVFLVSQLVEAGVFGNVASSPHFFERAGNVVVLPFTNESVWWFEANKHAVSIVGNHGGLSHDEMRIPFFAFEYT